MDSEILLLQELRETESVELARLGRGSSVEIGRSPAANGLTIASDAVSSVHGRIFTLGSCWVFQDLGSTNGSWVNGETAPAGAIRLLRSGDSLQLADVSIVITELNAAGYPVVGRGQQGAKRSLLVTRGGSFVGEFSVPEYGQALSVGGQNGTLEYDGMVRNESVLVISRKGMYTTISHLAEGVSVALGGMVIDRPTNIRDGDLITVSNYQIIFNDPPVATTSSVANTIGVADWGNNAPGSSPDATLHAITSALLDKPAQSSVFGRRLEISVDEIASDDTQRLNQSTVSKIYGRDYHPSMRSQGVDEKFSFESFEERAVWIIGFALFLAFLILLAIWLFAKQPVA